MFYRFRSPLFIAVVIASTSLVTAGACSRGGKHGAMPDGDTQRPGDGDVPADGGGDGLSDRGTDDPRDAWPDMVSDGRGTDAPPPVPPFACDPVHQTGCGSAEKCDIAASGTFGCVPAGTVGDFRVCDPTRPNACAAGFSCRGTNYGDYRCARLCNPSEDQCREGETCSSVRMTEDGREYRMCASLDQCNPIVDDCTDTSKHCKFNIRGFCMDSGNVADGDICRTSADCGPRSSCLRVRPDSRCFKLCDPTEASSACGVGIACTHFANVGPQAVGACGYSPP